MRSVNSNISNKSAPRDRSRSTESASGIKAARFGSQLLAIEQRMLFDGALALTVDATRVNTEYADKTSIVDKSLDRAAVLSGAAAKAFATSVPRDLVVIDTSIADWQTVANAANPNSQLLLLNPEQDGLSQIANAMVGGNFKSVHIVSHGDDGKLKLGTRSVTAANIEQYSADLQRIGQNLTETGDIVLYGCEIGKGAAGASFLQALARATNADIAASTNNTGGVTKGGDWVLEAQTGSIEDLAALDSTALTSYSGLLPVTNLALTIVETSDVDTDPGSIALDNDLNPENSVTVGVAPGEIVRYRMIVELQEGSATGARIEATLPSGLKFLDDGSAAVRFVSNNGISSTVIGAGAGVVGSGSTLGSIAAQRPSFAITATGGLNTGDPVTFDLGDLINSDSDAGGEFIVIEFNAMVDNASTNIVRSAQQAASFNYRDNSSSLPVESDIDTLNIIEPEIVDVEKRFVSLVGNTATFETTFTNSGDSNADTVRVVDTFLGYPNITFGATNTITVTRTDTGGTNNVAVVNGPSGIDFVINTVKPGDVITVTYTATVTDVSQAVPSQDMQVTYTSLSEYGGILAPAASGPSQSNSSGERTGVNAGYGAPMNTYIDSDGAGIGVISGRLWDDTPAYGAGLPSDSYVAGERTLGGITVNLRDVATNSIIRTMQTLANGTYAFTGLALGDYRIEVATPTINDSGVGGSGQVKIRYDAGGGTSVQQSDGLISLTLGDGVAAVNQDYGFVQINEAPVVSKPGDKSIAVNSVLSFDNGSGATSAGFITVSDEIQNIATANMATLTVSNGTLDFPTTYTPPAGFTVTGRGTANLMITGAINSLIVGAPTINTILAQLQYRPTTGFVGNDQLVVRVDDKGALGDADGDYRPNEVVDDNLFDSKTINITMLAGGNNPPVAVDDVRTVQANQTITNGQAINGNGLGDSRDTDPDIADAGLLTICGVEAGSKTVVGSTGVGNAIVGTYGTLVLQSNGSYTYTPNAVGQALQVGTTRVDQFSYCLQDPAGSKDVGLITINLTGVKNPPAGADKFIPLTEDTPYKITPSDFGFTDPDVDTFKAVRITELPNPAGGKLFFDGREVIFTTANPFLTVSFADMGKLEFRPAPDVNTATLSAPPSISFQVCDSDGVLDPTPNKLTFSIAPANDPPKASQSVYDMDLTSPVCALDSLLPTAGNKPGVSDPDIPADTLTVAITAVPPATEGQYFIGSSTVPLKAGDTLTPAQLQQLCFKPNPAISGTPNSTGRIPTTPLTFTVSDGKGGQDTSGSIQMNVRKQPVISVPPLPPVVPAPPIVLPPVVPPLTTLPVSRTISAVSALRAFDDLRFSPIEDAKDLDAGGFFDGASIKSVWNRERVAGVQVVAEEKQVIPVKQAVDCLPTPKEKPKLKAVKRSVFAETLKDNANKNFSEQLKTAQKRFKPPTRLMPKPSLVKEC